MDGWHVEPVTMPWHKLSIPCACGSEHGCYVEFNIPPALGGLLLAGRHLRTWGSKTLRLVHLYSVCPVIVQGRSVQAENVQTKSDATTLPCNRQTPRVPPKSKTLSHLSRHFRGPCRHSTRPLQAR